MGHRGLHPRDADRWKLTAWDALDGARRDAAADAVHQLRALLADVAGKWAGLAPDVRALDAFPTEVQLGRLIREQQDAGAPCTPDAVPSEARSCVVPEVGEQPGLQDVAWWEPEAQTAALKLKSFVVAAEAERLQLPVAEAAQPRAGRVALVQAALMPRGPQASQPQE